MKRSIGKIVGILLIVSMLLAFAGCGNSKSGDKEQFVGTWKAELDMTDLFNEGLKQEIAQEDEEMASYFDIEHFGFTVIFKFNEDDTYTTEIDDASLNASMDAMKACVRDGMMAYFEDMIAEYELDMSVEDMLEASGISIEDIIEEGLSADMFDDVLAELEMHGNWKAENGKLYTTETVNDKIDKNSYELYEITSEGIKLSLVDPTEDETGIFPMLLKKVG